MQTEMQTIERWEKLRRLASDNEFYIYMEEGRIKLRPGILKIRDENGRIPEKSFDSMDLLDSWLQGAMWQQDYATQLGFDQKKAENDVRDQRDRDRILRVLSQD